MYVCLCHGLTERDVRNAIDQGCRSVAAVYRQLADRPQCGKCVPDVRCMIQQSRCAHHAAISHTAVSHAAVSHAGGAGHAMPLAAAAQAES